MKKWKRKLLITGAVLLALLAAGYAGLQLLMTTFVNRYYQDAYAPLELAAGSLGAYPAEYHLDDVPWISTQRAYCQSNTLQMIAAQKGIEQPRGYFDLLMGFTYGAAEVPGRIGFSPYTDPEPGSVTAAPYLGLVRRYYVTDDDELYRDALRYYLSRGYPLRLGLDYAVLYDLGSGLPHSDLLVGYDESGFYYYETVCMAGIPCRPGYLPPGEVGLHITDHKLLQAVLGQAEQFSYPWRYSFTLFESGPLVEDMRPIWARDSQQLIGGVKYGPRQGADAIQKLADAIKQRGPRLDLSGILPELEAAVYIRRDNAAYLRQAFAGEADIQQSAALFDRAAMDYQSALDACQDGITDQSEADRIAAWLVDAAAAEREAGRIFLERGHQQ